jgi:hypothetical protein
MLRLLIGGNNGNIINPTEENNVFVCTGWWFGRGMVRSAYWRRMAQYPHGSTAVLLQYGNLTNYKNSGSVFTVYYYSTTETSI